MILALYGLNYSGKTRLVKEVISFDRSSFSYKKFKKVKFMISKKMKLIVIGHYPEEGIYIGADQISRSLIPQVCELIKKLKRSHQEYNILFEGTRLNNSDLIAFIKRKRFYFEPIYISCSQESMHLRSLERIEPHSESVKEKNYRACKILNEALSPSVINNDSLYELEKNVKILLGVLNIRIKTKVK